MARNKNSTALFDVIHAAKKPPKSSPSASIPAPRWWGKDKKPLKPAAAEPIENVGKQQSWLTAAKRNGGVAPPPATPALAEAPPIAQSEDPVQSIQPDITVAESPAAADPEPAAPKMRFIDRFKSRAAQAAPVVEESAVAVATEPVEPEQSIEPADLPLPVFYSEAEAVEPKPEPRPSPTMDNRDSMVAFDNITGDIRFHLSYGGIIAIGFILLMALAIAFIAGTRSGSIFALSDDSDSKAPVLNAPSTSGLALAVSSSKASDADHAVTPDVLAVSPKWPRPVADNSSTPAAAPMPLPIKATRDIGMIYVVIQSYPDQDIAQKACDFVNHAGVPCTLVQGLSGWAMHDWYSVVGLQPFKKHDPGLEQYERAVTGLGFKFSEKIYNQFQPQGYTWRADSDQEIQP